MKIIGILGLLLAVTFGMLAAAGVFSLQNDAATVSLPTGPQAVVDNAGNFVYFIIAIVIILLLVGAAVLVWGRR